MDAYTSKKLNMHFSTNWQISYSNLTFTQDKKESICMFTSRYFIDCWVIGNK